ncbi:MAG: DUF2958 domain-containing protein [Methylocella sp.]
MQLIPEALRARMLANDRNLPNDADPVPVVKLFAPGAAATSLRSISGLATLSNTVRPLSRNFDSRFTPQPHGKPALFQPLKHGSRTPAATQH